jgi:hypothetical protein
VLVPVPGPRNTLVSETQNTPALALSSISASPRPTPTRLPPSLAAGAAAAGARFGRSAERTDMTAR